MMQHVGRQWGLTTVTKRMKGKVVCTNLQFNDPYSKVKLKNLASLWDKDASTKPSAVLKHKQLKDEIAVLQKFIVASRAGRRWKCEQ